MTSEVIGFVHLGKISEFYYLEIDIPDDEMCLMLLTKLFTENSAVIEFFSNVWMSLSIEKSYFNLTKDEIELLRSKFIYLKV